MFAFTYSRVGTYVRFIMVTLTKIMLLLLNLFSFPYFQRPRVCILGGGFGGLYTALRLESLVWPSDKKPQVK
jgi:demethylphylloquinone reductase